MLTPVPMTRDLDPAYLALVSSTEGELLRAARLLTGDWTGAETLLRSTLAWALRAWEVLGGDPAARIRLRQRLIATYLVSTDDPAAAALPYADIAAADWSPPPGAADSAPEPVGVAPSRGLSDMLMDPAGRHTTHETGSASGGGPTGSAGDAVAPGTAAPGSAPAAGAQTTAAAAGVPGVPGPPGDEDADVPVRAVRGADDHAGAARNGAAAAGAGRWPSRRGSGGSDAMAYGAGAAAANGGTALVTALSTLDPEERALVVSRYYLGLSAAEIGEILGDDAEEVTIAAARLRSGLPHPLLG
jgi:hypothetical protein